MKQREVPQDHLAAYGSERRALYAVDDGGKYRTAKSDGWDVEEVVNSLAIDEYARLADEALARARSGETSPLEFHMYDRRLEPPTLAQAAGTWTWRVNRHLRPEVFAKLDTAWLQRYADALGVSVAELRALPQPANRTLHSETGSPA